MMVLLCPIQGPWVSRFFLHLFHCFVFVLNIFSALSEKRGQLPIIIICISVLRHIYEIVAPKVLLLALHFGRNVLHTKAV